MDYPIGARMAAAAKFTPEACDTARTAEIWLEVERIDNALGYLSNVCAELEGAFGPVLRPAPDSDNERGTPPPVPSFTALGSKLQQFQDQIEHTANYVASIKSRSEV